jgi:hypothetical protein
MVSVIILMGSFALGVVVAFCVAVSGYSYLVSEPKLLDFPYWLVFAVMVVYVVTMIVQWVEADLVQERLYAPVASLAVLLLVLPVVLTFLGERFDWVTVYNCRLYPAYLLLGMELVWIWSHAWDYMFNQPVPSPRRQGVTQG